jgi:integrase
MSELRDSLDEYLRLRRSLGYKLERAGKGLADFVDFLDDTSATHISVGLAVAWAIQAPGAESSWRAGRLAMVRGFARYLKAIDTRHQVPPTGLIPRRRGRPTPYLFSEADIAAVMAAADELRSPLRRSTIKTLIGTLAVTGLRVGEVIRLDRGNLDVDAGVLVVRNSKGGKSRDVPLAPSTLTALVAYRSHRDQLFPDAHSLFISTTGTRLRPSNLGTTFGELVTRAGLEPGAGGQRPRLGGLRHSFAVRTLLGFYASGADVAAMLPVLSSYMGHVSPASTYWYLSAAPELLLAAAQRVEAGLR